MRALRGHQQTRADVEDFLHVFPDGRAEIFLVGSVLRAPGRNPCQRRAGECREAVVRKRCSYRLIVVAEVHRDDALVAVFTDGIAFGDFQVVIHHRQHTAHVVCVGKGYVGHFLILAWKDQESRSRATAFARLRCARDGGTENRGAVPRDRTGLV